MPASSYITNANKEPSGTWGRFISSIKPLATKLENERLEKSQLCCKTVYALPEIAEIHPRFHLYLQDGAL